MTIAFDIRAVHDRTLRSDLQKHRSGLIDHYGNALGGFAGLSAERRIQVERAAHLMALAWTQRARAQSLTDKDEADLKRLEGIATASVVDLGIPLR
jgi:hypothetical protein